MSFKETELGKLPVQWDVRFLGDISTIQNGYAFKSKNFSDIGHSVIKIKNVNGRLVDLNDCQLYPFDLCVNLNKFKIDNNDILIAMTGAGSVGRVSKFLSKDSKTYYLNQRVGKVIPNKDILYNEFLFQILSTERYESILFDLANGSGQPNLSPSTIGLVKIPCPPIEEQKSIANILSTLDEKIEVNNVINKTLEEMAQAIFKQWFVDFEFPNENGEPYKSSGGQMVESELGMIPKGWEVIELSKLGNIVTGKTPSTKQVENFGNKYNFITPRDIKDSLYILKSERLLSEIGAEKLKTIKIKKNSIAVSCIGSNLGEVYINAEDGFTNQQINSIVLNKEEIYPFIYIILKNMKEDFINIAGGSAVPIINKTTFSAIKIIKPSDEELYRFLQAVTQMFETIKINLLQNNNMSELRDSILQKLMSGEIRVPINE